jgi:hypothetical protein
MSSARSSTRHSAPPLSDTVPEVAGDTLFDLCATGAIERVATALRELSTSDTDVINSFGTVSVKKIGRLGICRRRRGSDGVAVYAIGQGPAATALMFAVVEARVDVVVHLLQFGADPMLAGANLPSAYDMAKENGFTSFVELFDLVKKQQLPRKSN